MAIVISRESGIGALIPHLEQEHVGKANGVTHTAVYPEYQPAEPDTRCTIWRISSKR